MWVPPTSGQLNEAIITPAFTTPEAVAVGWILKMDSSSTQSGFATGFIWGIIFTIVVVGLIGTTILHKSDIYGLGHWKLNIRSPPPSMWMNVGYW